jgi:GntR family transcriptional regulator
LVSFVPRYHEIELALRRRIAGLRPGDALPSDAMLCQEFHVSRMTARGAVQRLAQEGLVVRVPGKGTYVAQPPGFRQASSLLSFTREMTRRGMRPSSRLLARGLRPAREVELARLHLRPGSEVVEIRRLRLADGEPIVVESTALPAACAPIVLEADLEHGSLHEALVEGRRIPTRGRATLRAEAASADDGALLGVEPGSPLLVERRVIDDQRGRPLELTESRYAAGRYSLDVAFDVDDAGGHLAEPTLDARGARG